MSQSICQHQECNRKGRYLDDNGECHHCRSDELKALITAVNFVFREPYAVRDAVLWLLERERRRFKK